MIREPLLPLLRRKAKTINRRLLIAMACYFVLVLAALYALLPARTYQEKLLLWAVLCVFAILIVKTLIHSQIDKDE